MLTEEHKKKISEGLKRYYRKAQAKTVEVENKIQSNFKRLEESFKVKPRTTKVDITDSFVKNLKAKASVQSQVEKSDSSMKAMKAAAKQRNLSTRTSPDLTLAEKLKNVKGIVSYNINKAINRKK